MISRVRVGLAAAAPDDAAAAAPDDAAAAASDDAAAAASDDAAAAASVATEGGGGGREVGARSHRKLG